jgi:pre-60S factor REI1
LKRGAPNCVYHNHAYQMLPLPAVVHCLSGSNRYNLKRKIAGLPPVTREWYEARKAQLLATASTPVHKVWFDPLSKKKFYSENTYLAFTR